MTFLVDANVLSEATKAKPDANVVAWLRQNEAELVVDPIILGEMLADADPKRSQRAMEAMLKMKKLSIDALKRAYEGQ